RADIRDAPADVHLTRAMDELGVCDHAQQKLLDTDGLLESKTAVERRTGYDEMCALHLLDDAADQVELAVVYLEVLIGSRQIVYGHLSVVLRRRLASRGGIGVHLQTGRGVYPRLRACHDRVYVFLLALRRNRYTDVIPLHFPRDLAQDLYPVLDHLVTAPLP